jgi:hypothetical protein
MSLNPVEDEVEDEEAAWSSEGSKCPSYMKIKESLIPTECIRRAYSAPSYKADIEANLLPKPTYTLQAYKYKIEAFTPELRAQYAKDLTKHSSISCTL